MLSISVIFILLSQVLSLKVNPSLAGGFGIPTGMIRLHPPANFTIGYVGTYNIYVYWYEPMNYHLHIPIDYATFVPGSEKNGTDAVTTNSSVANSSNVGYKVVTSAPEQGPSTESAGTVNATSWIGHSLVPFHMGTLIDYQIMWKKIGEEKTNHKTLRTNQTEYHFKDMEPNTMYQISVSAQYASLTVLKSEEINVTTHPTMNHTDSNTDRCYCDPYGTVEGGKKCAFLGISHVPICTCKDGHSGMFCEKCAVTHFRINPKELCYKCPCNKNNSDGTCQFYEDKLVCSACKEGYKGNHCENCDTGYWRQTQSSPCQKCFCRGRSDICDPLSGHCMLCSEHTTGYSCERCQSGYVGDPINDQSCVHKDHISQHTGSIVVGVCIGLLLLICAVAAYVLIRKWRKLPRSNKFWTVELRDDHERVNFSALPEDEIQARRMDYDFYQDQGGTRTRDGTQKYSHLQEI